MDLSPGSLVEYKNHKKGEQIFYTRSSKPSNFNMSPAKDFYKKVDVESGTYLLYLGIETLGPRALSDSRCLHIRGDQVYVHQFLYDERILYLEISKPDRYYTVFRKHFKRTDDKNNFCR